LCCKDSSEREEGLDDCSVSRQPEHLINDPIPCEDILLRNAPKLALTKYMDGFMALDRLLRYVECPKSQTRVDAPLYRPMILFYALFTYLHCLSVHVSRGVPQDSNASKAGG
jgi:hypothetical protein